MSVPEQERTALWDPRFSWRSKNHPHRSTTPL